MARYRIQRDGYALAVDGTVYSGAQVIEADPATLPPSDALHGALARGWVVALDAARPCASAAPQSEPEPQERESAPEAPAKPARATRKRTGATTRKRATRKRTE